MGLIQLIVIIAFIGLILWAVNKLIPMEPTIRNVLNVTVAVVVILFVLSLLTGGLPNIRIG